MTLQILFLAGITLLLGVQRTFPFSCFLACLLKSSGKVRSHDGNIVCEAGYRLEEFAEQYEDAVYLNKETDQWPAKEDEDDWVY